MLFWWLFSKRQIPFLRGHEPVKNEPYSLGRNISLKRTFIAQQQQNAQICLQIFRFDTDVNVFVMFYGIHFFQFKLFNRLLSHKSHTDWTTLFDFQLVK